MLNKLKDSDKIKFYKTDYIENTKGFMIGDLILAILEQKSLGVFQNDIKPANLIVDKSNKLYIIDYDQAITLDNKVSSLGSKDYIRWTMNQDYINYNVKKKDWLRYFYLMN